MGAMYTVPIERGKIREFAIAVQSTNPAYHSADPVVPPTFLTTGALNWEPDDEFAYASFDFDVARVLHAEEEYVFFGPPPRAGAELTVSTRLGDRYEKAGKRGGTMRFASVVREFRDQHGALVAEQRTTLVETARPATES